MDPALIGIRLASSASGPLLRKLLAKDGPGAGLTGARTPVRLSGLVSFRGEKRTLTEKEVRKLATTLVERAAAGPGEPPFPADETEALTDTLAATLLALGDLDMDDVQAVHLGPAALARGLRAAAPPPDGLSTDSVLFLDSLTEWACLHILEFFTQRSTFVARTLVEQTRGQAELTAKVDEVIRRTPRGDARDAEFERRYLAYVAKKQGRLTIYGLDLHHSPDEWPLDLAYLSLEATGPGPAPADDDTAWDELGTREQLFRLRHPGPATLPADRALATHPRILLRGLAGSGKTTLVQWLAVSAASQGRAGDRSPGGEMAYLRDRVPFVLPLRALTRHGERLPSPDRFLAAAGCPLTPPDGWADRVLTAGRGLILVDGIDEIPEAERERARRWLRELLDSYDGNRWLVTSRPTAVRDDWLTPDGFTELALSPMSRAEVTTFVQRWHRAAGPEAQPYEQPLLDALRTTEHAAQLATNPLMCGLICALHRDRRGFLPRGRKALYEAALSMLLSRRDRERDMGTPYGIELGEAPQIQLIQRLAYWLTLNGRTQMDRSHAESIVRSAVPAIPEAAAYGDPDAVFTHLLHRSGLLREPTPDTVDFVHRTFQDHLAAKVLVDDWHIGVLIDHAADDQWEDVVRMAVGHARPRECAEIFEELLRAADAAEDRRTQLRVLVVAATALEEATEVAPEVQARILERTARVIPPRTPEEARELASVGRAVLDLLPGPEGLSDREALMVVTAATHIPHDAALPHLARFVDHPWIQVRSQLIWAWSRYDTRQYAQEIIGRLAPGGLDFTLRSDEQIDELVRLGRRPEALDLRHGVSERGMAALGPVLAEVESVQFAAATAGNSLWLLLRGRGHEGKSGATSRVPRLRFLHLSGFYAPTEEDWHAIAGTPSLRELTIGTAALRSCPEPLLLPQVDHLILHGNEADPPFEQVVRAFPALRGVILSDTGEGRAYDISPLARLKHLRLLQMPGVEITGAGHLSPTVDIVV